MARCKCSGGLAGMTAREAKELRAAREAARVHEDRWAFTAPYEAIQPWRVRVFNLVAPRPNWKVAISADVTKAALAAADASIGDVLAAIRWFAGGDGSATPITGGYHVAAPGYYAKIGA